MLRGEKQNKSALSNAKRQRLVFSVCQIFLKGGRGESGNCGCRDANRVANWTHVTFTAGSYLRDMGSVSKSDGIDVTQVRTTLNCKRLWRQARHMQVHPFTMTPGSPAIEVGHRNNAQPARRT